MAGLAGEWIAAVAPQLQRWSAGISNVAASIFPTRYLPTTLPSLADLPTLRDGCQHALVRMGATVFTVTRTVIVSIPKLKRKRTDALDAPTAKRPQLSHLSRRIARPRSNHKKRKHGDDEINWAVYFVRQDPLNGSRLGSHLAKKRRRMSRVSSAVERLAQDGRAQSNGSEEEYDDDVEWLRRSMQKAQLKQDAQQAALKESQIRLEARAEEKRLAQEAKEARRRKKRALIAKTRKQDLEEGTKSFRKAKAEYEAYVQSVLKQIEELGFTSADTGPDGVRPRRDPFGRVLPDPKSTRKAPIEKLPADWLSKIQDVLNIRSDHAVVGKSVEGVELSRKDIGRILPGEPWLNDEVVNAWYANLCARLNEKDGYVKGPNKVPRWVAYSSAWYKNVAERGVNSIAGWSRRKGIKNDKLLQAERIFFPTNTGVHWTLLTISGTNKTIEYLDSLNTAGYKSRTHTDMAKAWLKMELGAKYNEDEWKVLHSVSAQQSNSNDCGVFACFNGWALGKGATDVSAEFGPKEMPLARKMLAAVLLNGGFTGDFDI